MGENCKVEILNDAPAIVCLIESVSRGKIPATNIHLSVNASVCRTKAGNS